jgi:hypothetical protein
VLPCSEGVRFIGDVGDILNNILLTAGRIRKWHLAQGAYSVS